MGKVRLKERLLDLDLIKPHDMSDDFEGVKGGGVESFFRGGGCLGLGSRLFKGKYRKGGKPVVLKQLFVGGEEVEEKGPVEMELHILKNYGHEHLVKYEAAFMTEHIDDGVWLVMAQCAGGSIADAIRMRDLPFNETQLQQTLHGLLRAVTHLHAQNYIHRDIRGENILLTAGGKAVLADLGTVGISNSTSAQVGTSHWMAPEMTSASSVPYDVKVDIWSIGITIIEMAEMETPAARDGGNETTTQMHSPKFAHPSTWSKSLNRLVTTCLEMDPKKRPSAAKLLASDFMKQKTKKEETLKELVKIVNHLRQQEETLAAERKSKWLDDDDDSTECDTVLGNSISSQVLEEKTQKEMSIHFDPVVSPPPVIKETTPAPLLRPESKEALTERNAELRKKVAALKNILKCELLLKDEAVFHKRNNKKTTSAVMLKKMEQEKELLAEKAATIKKNLLSMKTSITNLGVSISDVSSRLSDTSAPATHTSTSHPEPLRRLNTSTGLVKTASPSPSVVTRSLTQAQSQTHYVPGSLRKNAMLSRVRSDTKRK